MTQENKMKLYSVFNNYYYDIKDDTYDKPPNMYSPSNIIVSVHSGKKDAEHIVKCVNTHDDLVSALEDIAKCGRIDIAVEIAEEVLAKAKGQENDTGK